MITYDAWVDDRSGRVFARTAVPEDVLAEHFAASYFTDEEDRDRDALLRSILASPNVVVVTHRTVDPKDVIQAFFRRRDNGTSEKVFACVVVCRARLEAMLRETPLVVEGHSLQVAPTRTVTNSSIRAALEAWTERNFPDLPLPRFSLDPWRGELQDQPDRAFALLRLRRRARSAGSPPGVRDEYTFVFQPEPGLTDDSTRESAA